MKLRYLKGAFQVVNWAGTSDSTNFNPVGETTDERGKRLLANPAYQGWFEEVVEGAKDTPLLICDVCGATAKTKAGLGSHKRKHKEQ